MQQGKANQKGKKDEKGGNAMSNVIEQSRSKFLKIRCSKCKKERVVFGNSATKVVCDCGETLVESTGGKSRIKARILEVLG